MLGQNIKNYYFNKYKIKLSNQDYFDLTLVSDERDYDEEVVFSNDLIAENDGNRLPINIDLNSPLSNEKRKLYFGIKNPKNNIISKNYYNPKNLDLSCETEKTICDVGLTGIDTGLYDKMSGQTLTFTMGINDNYMYEPHHYDRRFKMNSIGTFAESPNERFSGNTRIAYNMISKEDTNVGWYHELYGGFYQGFYKLYGYDYEVFPERVNKGWTAEMLLRPRQRDEIPCIPGQSYLNDIYPNNAGTFFYFGTRAENKFYHHARGNQDDVASIPVNRCDLCVFDFSFSAASATTFSYERVTSELECLQTCACSDTGITISNCFDIYPRSATTQEHQYSRCGAYTEEIPNPPVDPAMDVVSNAMSIRFDGDPKNPRLCVKYVKMTGDCTTTVTCEKTETQYCSGYTINEICSTKGIYDVCGYNNILCETANTEERWVMISTVFERYKTLEECDLLNWGGLGDIRQFLYPSSINGAAYNLIQPPHTHEGAEKEEKENITKINKKWLSNDNRRLGKLKIYVNGYLFMVIEDFEEIIPRELNTQKEKQIGVPFNISFGGGTQGLKESLIFKNCEDSEGPYTQDPELMPNETLSGTSLSEMKTNILLEPNFAGTFMGGISQFRMYVEPLSSPQVQHNFRRLKNRFDLFDYWCPNCYNCLLSCYFNFELSNDLCEFDFSFCDVDCSFDTVISEITCDFNFQIIK